MLWPAAEGASGAGPSLGGWHPLDTPPGVAALVGLGVLVGSANLLYERWQGPAPLVPLLAAGAAGVVVADLPTGHGVPAVLPWVVGAALVALTAKLLILHRYARAHPGADGSGAGRRLLASRRRDLADLDEMVRALDGPGRVIPIVGRWGEGKSFLLDALRERWDRPGSPTLALIDVWRLEGERDLQAAILDALLAHPHNRRRLRWLFFPLMLPVSGVIRTVTLGLSRSGMIAEVEVRLPALNWQRLFEQTTGRSPHGTVIALDELDRAVPAAAQAALTLAKRSGTIPGVTILLSYNDELIRYKVFNPLLPSLPDLASTMEAVLYAELYPALQQKSPRIIAEAWATSSSDPGRESSSSDPGRESSSSDPGRKSSWADVTRSGPVGIALLRMFAEQPLPVRQRLQARFEEKYLGSASLVMRRPAPDGLDEIVKVFPEPRRQVAQLLGVGEDALDGKDGPSIRSGAGTAPEAAKVAEFYRALSTGAGHSQRLVGEYPPIRVLHGALCEILQIARQRVAAGSLPEARTPEMAAVLVLVALDLAVRTYLYSLTASVRPDGARGPENR